MRAQLVHVMAIGIALIAVLAGCTTGLDPIALREPSTSAAPSTTKAAANLVEKGDCVHDNGNDYTEVPCGSATATHVALDRLPGSTADCRKVPGVDYTYVDSANGNSAKVCLGVKGEDPSDGLNVVRVGDCVLSAEGVKGKRVPCTDPGTVFRVLGLLEHSTVTPQTCSAFPGTTRTHGWRLKQLGLDLTPPGPKVYDLVFCMTPVR